MAWTSVITLVAVVTCCHGYSLGPPLTACQNMFPEGHGVAAQSSEPPFSFTLSTKTYNPGDVISVFLNSSGDWFMEGALIQVRSVNCSDYSAYGTFTADVNDTFLEEFNCFNRAGSALRHYAHYHIYNRTFTWTAPAQASGHLYIRATIARNQATFWTNVFSDYIKDNSDQSNATMRCDAAPEVSSARTITSTFSMVLTCVVTLCALMLV